MAQLPTGAFFHLVVNGNAQIVKIKRDPKVHAAKRRLQCEASNAKQQMATTLKKLAQLLVTVLKDGLDCAAIPRNSAGVARQLLEYYKLAVQNKGIPSDVPTLNVNQTVIAELVGEGLVIELEPWYPDKKFVIFPKLLARIFISG